MNYVKFLKHHVPIIDLIDEVDQPTRKSFSSNKENSSDRTHTNELSKKLKRKVKISFFLQK
jgi:hypothetical protein